MKRKTIYILFLILALCACNKPGTMEQQPSDTSDSLLSHALQSIFDPSLSCLDAKDEIMMLLDTMQSHVESCPDEQIRIGAKSLALEIGSMFLYNDSITPEEEKFFEDSLLFPLIDIQSTWYCPPYVPNNMTDWAAQPVLLQEIVFRYDYSNDIHVIKLAIYYHPEKSDILSIEMPVEAEYLMSIGFMNDSTRMVDTSTVFTLADSFESIPRTEESGAMLFYNQNLIYEMLTHNDMLIMFIGTEEAENLEDRFHYVHLSLNKFHEQFYSVLQMLKDKTE